MWARTSKVSSAATMARDVAQVGADDVRRGSAPEELAGLGPAVAVGQAVQRAEDPVEGAGREHPGDGLGVQVRFAELEPAEDAQAG